MPTIDVKRPLLATAAMLAAGAAVGRTLELGPWLLPALIWVLLAVNAVRLEVAFRRGRPLPAPVFLFLAMAALSAWRVELKHADLRESKRLITLIRSSGPVQIEGRICGPPRVVGSKTLFILSEPRVFWKDTPVLLPARVQLQIPTGALNRPAAPRLRPGDTLRTTASLNLPQATSNPRAWDYGAYLEELGIAGQARVAPGAPISVQPASGWRVPLAALAGAALSTNAWVQRTFTELFSERPARLVTALFLGGSYRLRAERDAFLNTGLMHLFSVSGLHAGFVALLLFGGLHLVGFSNRWAIVLAVPGLLFYVALVGFPTAAVRAFIMTCCFALAPLLNRRPDGMTALSLAAVLILLWDPCAVFQADFQLSFLSMGAIIVLYPSLRELTWPHVEQDEDELRRRWFRRAQIWIVQPLVLTAIIQLTLTPLLAQYYHRVSLVAPLANAAGAAAAFLIYAGLFAVLALRLAAPAAAELAAGVIGSGAEAFLNVLSRVGEHPWSAATLMPFPWWLTGLWYGVLFGGRYVLEENRPHSRLRRRASWLLHGAALVAMLVWYPLWQWRGRTLEGVFLDVGQGDSFFLAAPDGATLLVDGGRNFPRDMGRDVIGPFLESAGVDVLDVVVATHPDADHIGGLSWVVEHFEVGRLVTNGQRRTTGPWRALEEAAGRLGVPVTAVRRGQRLSGLGGVEIVVLHPTEKWVQSGDTNNASVVLWLRYRNLTIMLTGDAEFAAEADIERAGLAWPAVVLKAGHHGSPTSTSARWLERLKPRVVVFSVGADNSYGHPSPSVIERCEDIGAATFRTDRHGAVTLRSDGHSLTVVSEKNAPAP
ncbi:MAG: DNA internalization-related competence protein ComEC/Rec2 [Candidatus Sumerlaeia bacterium]